MPVCVCILGDIRRWMALRAGSSAETFARNEMQLFLLFLVTAFIALVVIRVAAIRTARRAEANDEYLMEIGRLPLFPANTPGELVRSLGCFWRAFVRRPMSPVGLISGCYLLLWFLLVMAAIYGVLKGTVGS